MCFVSSTPRIPRVPRPRDEETLSFEFEDDDTYGCNVRVSTSPAGTGEWTRRVDDKFLRHTAGGAPFDTSFVVAPEGLYDLELRLWDVGGRHKVTQTLRFNTCGVREEAPALQTGLAPGKPNPSSEWVRWSVELKDRGPARLRIVQADGRCVRELGSASPSGDATSVVWDGRDGHGRRVAAGKYYLSVETSAGRQLKGSVVVVQ